MVRSTRENIQRYQENNMYQHYLYLLDPSKHTVVQVDASSRGLVEVFLQYFRSITFAYKSLIQYEQYYANIEREILVVVFGGTQFYSYVYGNPNIIFLLNSRSFRSNFDNIIQLLTEIKFNFDFIIFTETWLTLHDIDIYKISNYTSIHTIRNNKRGGGVAIYINNNLNFNILYNLTFTIDNLIDICTIEFIYNNTNIILSSIYRPPYSNIDSFTHIISNYLHSISHNKTVYVFGDFNIDIFKHNNNKHIKDFIDNIYQFGYITR